MKTKKVSKEVKDQGIEENINDISSIGHKDQMRDISQELSLIEDEYDITKIDNKKYYQTQNIFYMGTTARDAYNCSKDIIKKLLHETNIQCLNLEYNTKVPDWTIQRTNQICDRLVCGQFIENDKCDTRSYYGEKGKLIVDQEPQPPLLDTWNRAMIKSVEKEVEGGIENLPDSRVVVSRQGRRSSRTSSMGGKHKKQDDFDPLSLHPIDLQEPQHISEQEKEERKKKEHAQELIDKRNHEIALEKQRIEDEKEEKQKNFYKQNKTTNFTFDFEGNPIPIHKVKMGRLPPSAYQINYEFKQEGKELPNKKKKQSKQVPQKKQQQKSTPKIEQQFVSEMVNMPPLLDNIELKEGIKLTVDGKVRIGPRPQTVDQDTLNSFYEKTSPSHQFLKMTKLQYKEFVKTQGYQRNSREGGDRMLHSAGDMKTNLSVNSSDLYPLKFMNDQQQQNENLVRVKKQEQTQQYQREGEITIKNHQEFNLMAHAISEEEEILLKKLQEKHYKELIEAERLREAKKFKSPIDAFNIEQTQGSSWGRSVHSRERPNLVTSHHPSNQDMFETLGTSLKPRQRFMVKTPDHVPAFDLRCTKSSEGFHRKLMQPPKTSESIRIHTQHKK